jgi:hypothetical protein
MVLKGVGLGVDWIHLAQDRDQRQAVMKMVMDVMGFHNMQ